MFIVCYDDISLIFNKDDQDKKVETPMAPSKKQESLPLRQETKQESGSGKKKVSSKKQKTENGECVNTYFLNTDSREVHEGKDPGDLTCSLILSSMCTPVTVILIQVQVLFRLVAF